MADHDELQSEEFHERLSGVASAIDVGTFEHERSKVDDLVGRRRTRKRVAAVLGAAAAIGLVATTVVLTMGGDEPDTLVTTDDTMAPDTILDDSVDAPEPTLDLPVAAAQPVQLIDVTAGPGSVAGVNGAPEYGEWIVPWDDGFLVGSMGYQPQPLPDELPEEVVALFPQEVIDLFGGDLPATISEATEQLSEAGLLEVVSDIIQNNPAASEAIYGVETGPPTLDVRYTVDGVTWEPREVVAPAGATYFSGVTAVDDRLAVVYSDIDPLTGATSDGSVTVATTSDLSTWTEQDIVVPSPGELPEGINWSVYAQGLVANDNGWVLAVSDSIDADPYGCCPRTFSTRWMPGTGSGSAPPAPVSESTTASTPMATVPPRVERSPGTSSAWHPRWRSCWPRRTTRRHCGLRRGTASPPRRRAAGDGPDRDARRPDSCSGPIRRGSRPMGSHGRRALCPTARPGCPGRSTSTAG